MREQIVRAAPFLSDRRHFLGRVAATTAIVMTGGIGLRRVAGQNAPSEVNTAVPAMKGRQHGIVDLPRPPNRFWCRGSHGSSTAQWHRRRSGQAGGPREFRREDNQSGRTIRRVAREVTELTWLSETLVVEAVGSQIHVTYNGHPLGTVNGANRQADPAVLAWTKQRSQLLQIISDINSDVAAMLPLTREVASGALSFGAEPLLAQCDVLCGQDYTTGDGDSRSRSSACEDATEDANINCWNNYCAGCCAWQGDCNCWCAEGDFWCWCHRSGRYCECVKGALATALSMEIMP